MRLSEAAGPAFAAGVALTALVFSPAAYDPNAPRWIAFAAAGSVAWFVVALSICRGELRFDGLDLAAAALLGYALASLIWSPDPAQGAATFAALFAATGVFVFARRRPGDGAEESWIAGACQAGLFGLLALNFAGVMRAGGLGNENFLAESLAALLPLACVPAATGLADRRHLLWLVVPLAAAATLAFALPTKAGIVALAAICALALASGWGVLARVASVWRYGILAALAIAACAALWLRGPAELAASFAARMELAINTLYLWRDHALLGVGLGGFEPLYPAYQERHFALLGDGAGLLTLKNWRAGAAHNEPVQFLATFGVLGGGLIALAAFAAPRAAPAAWTAGRRAATATVVAVLVVGMTGFPLQMPLTLLLFAYGLGRSLPGATAGRPIPNCGPAAFAAATCVAAALLCVAALNWIGSERLGATKRAIGVDPAAAERLHDAARAVAPWDYTIRSARFVTFAYAREAEREQTYDPAEADARFAESTGRGAPEMQVAMARVQMLQNSAVLTPAAASEMTALSNALVARASLVPETWILAGAVALRQGDPAAALAAVAQGRRLRVRFNSRRLEPALSRADQVALLDTIESVARAIQSGGPPGRLVLRLGFGEF